MQYVMIPDTDYKKYLSLRERFACHQYVKSVETSGVDEIRTLPL